MSANLRDMYCACALPTVKYNMSTLNPLGIVTLAAFFLSASIVISFGILLYKHIG